MMITAVDQNPVHSIELMQSSARTSVNQLHSPASTCTIYDNNHTFSTLTEKKSLNSSRIRLGLRCLCSFDDKQRRRSFFDRIFSIDEENSSISDYLLIECFQQRFFNIDRSETVLILTGEYQTIRPLETTILSSIRAHLIDQDYLIDLYVREVQLGKSLFLDTQSSSLSTSFDSLNFFCLHNSSLPLIITFHLRNRLSKFHLIRCSQENFDYFSSFLIELSLSSTSNRHKHSFHISSNKTNGSIRSFIYLTSFLHQFIIQSNDQDFLYLFSNVENEQQLKYWSKVQRKIIKMLRDSSSIDTRCQEEIWVDGPLSKSHGDKEIWIDGPREFSTPTRSKNRFQPLHTKSKCPSTLADEFDDCSKPSFDTESVVSSHCHLPVLPVFKDHTLIAFRSKSKPLPKLDLKLSANQLNDDLEILEKTLETLLVPQQNNEDNSQRIDQLSSLMSKDEKNHRLSRIVSPTRFDKLLISTSENSPQTPILSNKTRHSRVNQPLKKPETPVRTSSLAESIRTPTMTRPSIFQRLFGLRSSPPSSPLISPLTVTLDSHDDLMPLTSSSTTSSASGRASSSGYESTSATIFDENAFKYRTKSMRKGQPIWNSPTLREKSSNQRLNLLKQRQNQLRNELATTKGFLLNENIDPSSPIHRLPVLQNSSDEEHQLEQDIEYLERRLASAKTQLMLINAQRNHKLTLKS